jgi:hypothetical protein
MLAKLLLDNWTLQDVGHLLNNGFDRSSVPEIEFVKGGQDFRYRSVDRDLVRLDCLLRLLGAIVFSDRLFVDEGFVYTWKGVQCLEILGRAGLLVGTPFLDFKERWEPLREAFARELCVCRRIRELHSRNVQTFAKQGRVADNKLSTILWGGAGYLARGDYARLQYMPHPLRESLFERAIFLPRRAASLWHFEKFVGGERNKLFTRIDRSGGFVRASLPPAAALVVKEASNSGDILRVALEVRAEFKRVRRWLGEIQAAFEAGRVREMAREERLLKSVAGNVDALTGDYSDGETSLQCGASWLKVGFKLGKVINNVRNRLGVRAAMNRLIIADAGRDGLRKLIGFFATDGRRTLEIEQAFLRRSDWLNRRAKTES